jgi:hypothetical protein
MGPGDEEGRSLMAASPLHGTPSLPVPLHMRLSTTRETLFRPLGSAARDVDAAALLGALAAHAPTLASGAAGGGS